MASLGLNMSAPPCVTRPLPPISGERTVLLSDQALRAAGCLSCRMCPVTGRLHLSSLIVDMSELLSTPMPPSQRR